MTLDATKCPECGGPMTMLLTSAVCDRCHPPIANDDDVATEDYSGEWPINTALLVQFAKNNFECYRPLALLEDLPADENFIDRVEDLYTAHSSGKCCCNALWSLRVNVHKRGDAP